MKINRICSITIIALMFISAIILGINTKIKDIDHLTSNYELHKEDYINSLVLVGDSELVDKKELINSNTKKIIVSNNIINTDTRSRFISDRSIDKYFGEVLYLAALDTGKGNQGIGSTGIGAKYEFNTDRIIVDANYTDGIQVDDSDNRYALAIGKNDIALCVPYSISRGITDSNERKLLNEKKVDSWYMITALKILSTEDIGTGMIRRYKDDKYGNVIRNDNIGIQIVYGDTRKMRIIRYNDSSDYKIRTKSTNILSRIASDIYTMKTYTYNRNHEMSDKITGFDSEMDSWPVNRDDSRYVEGVPYYHSTREAPLKEIIHEKTEQIVEGEVDTENKDYGYNLYDKYAKYKPYGIRTFRGQYSK